MSVANRASRCGDGCNVGSDDPADVVEPIRLTAERSFWHRRHCAIAGFLAGYFGFWLFAGIAVSFLRIPHGAQNRAAAIAFAIAGGWELTRWKQRALSGCHRSMPLAPAAGAPTATAFASEP